MSKVIHLNTLKPYLAKLKVNGGMWQIGSGKYAIKHLEVEKLANLYGIETDINLIHCNLEKGCAVVKAGAKYNSKTFYCKMTRLQKELSVSTEQCKATSYHGNVQ